MTCRCTYDNEWIRRIDQSVTPGDGGIVDIPERTCVMDKNVNKCFVGWSYVDESVEPWGVAIVDKTERTMHRGQKLNGHVCTEQLCRRAEENRGVA